MSKEKCGIIFLVIKMALPITDSGVTDNKKGEAKA